jgi:hypothetical protein
VSEAISFVLVFSLVVATVGVVYATGLSGLQDARDAERFNNAERAFDVLADNVADMQREGAPSRATELKLSDASIGFGEETRVTVVIDGTTTDSVTLRPIVYDTGGRSQLAYENGAVVRSDGEGSVMLSEPDMVFDPDENVVVVPVVQTRPVAGTPTEVAGGGTVLVRTQLRTNEVLSSHTAGPHAVNLTVTTAPRRADAWERYLADALAPWGTPCTRPSADTVRCQFQADAVYVSAARLDTAIA